MRQRILRDQSYIILMRGLGLLLLVYALLFLGEGGRRLMAALSLSG
ncbi:MAG: hypothetical protein KDJ28_13650 [Candidatus Competibacteraceae bacterium]|nr:hypothetical protein [Candidatus Competibacteraceae bacterium]